jgi:hypothetical protein
MVVPLCTPALWQLRLYRFASAALTPFVILHLLRRRLVGMERAILPRLGMPPGVRRTPRPAAPPQPIPSAPSLAPELRCVAHSCMAAAAGEACCVAARRQRRGEPLGPDARIAPRSAARWRVPLCHHVRNRRGDSGALPAPPSTPRVARPPQPTAALPSPLRSWKSASARSRRRPRCAAWSRASRLLRTYPSRSGRSCAAGARTRSWPWRATYGPTCSTSAPRAGPRCCLSTRASAPAPPHAGRTGPRARSWPACSTAFRWYRPT